MAEMKLITGEVVLLDDEDADRVISQGKWRNNLGYAVHHGNRKGIRMHRFILNFPDSHIDHINGNPLDNRKSNLRLCTRSQNQHNRFKNRNSRSRYKGVSRDSQNKAWQARIKTNNKSQWLGRFITEEDAAKAYDDIAKQQHGEFARLNYDSHCEIPFLGGEKVRSLTDSNNIKASFY